MKSLKVVLLFVASIGLLAYGCAKSDDSDGSSSASTAKYSRTNTPSKSSASVPASLSGSGSASRTANQQISSVFYDMAKSGVMMMSSSVVSADLNLMFADAIYTSSTVGTCYDVNEYSITFTQEMYNSLVAMESEFGTEEGSDSSMSASMKQQIGKTMNPPIAYKISSISEGGYNTQLEIGESCSSLNETFRWDNDKKKLLSQFSDNNSGEVFTGTFTYDDNTKTSSFKMSIDMTGFEGKLTFTLRECNSTEASGTSGDCGIFSFTQNFSDPVNGTSLMKGSGKADDNGGFGKAKMTYGSSSMEYKEEWKGDGSVTYAAVKTGSGAFQVVGGTASGDYGSESDTFSSNPNTVNLSATITTAGSYEILIQGKTPSANPEAIVGYGEVSANDSFWDFWGAETSGTFDIWKVGGSKISQTATVSN